MRILITQALLAILRSPDGAATGTPAVGPDGVTPAASTDEASTKKEKKSNLPVRPKGEERNGVTMPGEDTDCRKIWDVAAAISAEKGRPAERKEVVAAAHAAGLSPATASTQFGRWCKYWGVTIERAKAVAKSAPAAPAAPADPQPVA